MELFDERAEGISHQRTPGRKCDYGLSRRDNRDTIRLDYCLTLTAQYGDGCRGALHPLHPQSGCQRRSVACAEAPVKHPRPVSPALVGPIFSGSTSDSAADVCQVLPRICMCRDLGWVAERVGFVPEDPAHINNVRTVSIPQITRNAQNLSTGTNQVHASRVGSIDSGSVMNGPRASSRVGAPLPVRSKFACMRIQNGLEPPLISRDARRIGSIATAGLVDGVG